MEPPCVDITINLGIIQSTRDPLKLECGATMCGHLCQLVDDPWISQLGILQS